MHSFGFKGTRWTSGIAADGHRAATPVCPEHDHREAKVLVALNDQVLVPESGVKAQIFKLAMVRAYRSWQEFDRQSFE